jgi:hypothetical protein
MLGECVGGTGWKVRYLIDQGIIQNNKMGGGSASWAVLQGKNTKFRGDTSD